jgi:hypothetical protein
VFWRRRMFNMAIADSGISMTERMLDRGEDEKAK